MGFASAIIEAYILNKTLKIRSKSYFVVEMPNYKLPLFKNIFINVVEKTKAFIFEAGKIILAISIVLWFLASYGPGKKFNKAAEIVKSEVVNQNISVTELNDKVAAYKLEHSYIGIVGKTIEPIIQPLGYDWKIGIALVTSFAAREVFNANLAISYSVEESDDEDRFLEQLRTKLAQATWPDGRKVYTPLTTMSLLVFFVYALQCLPTTVVVRRETGSWKWAIAQLVGMTAVAWLAAFAVYQIGSLLV